MAHLSCDRQECHQSQVFSCVIQILPSNSQVSVLPVWGTAAQAHCIRESLVPSSARETNSLQVQDVPPPHGQSSLLAWSRFQFFLNFAMAAKADLNIAK